jgi:glucokinase
MDSPRLLADIGGTSIRFGIGLPQGLVAHIQTFRTADLRSMELAIRHYLDTCQIVPTVAALATANPVAGDLIRMTNLDFSFSVEQLRKSLEMEAILVVNDFSALALGIPHVDTNELICLGGPAPVGCTLSVTEMKQSAPIGIIGPGTGLGMSGLVPTRLGWQALSSEGGHATLAPADALEAELLSMAWQRHEHISVERFVSGPGLLLLYELICQIHGDEVRESTPAAITERARAGECQASLEAVRVFCNLLATAAANLALTLGTRGGIFIGGGIAPKLGSLLDATAFRSRFEDHGRLGPYLRSVPTLLITAPYPALGGLNALLTAWRTHGDHAPLPFDLTLAQR